MEKVELGPLKPKQMVEAYRKRFYRLEPFTQDALLALARMSRGIFRRFLRYITLTLIRWEIDHLKGPIDTTIVREAVTVARLAEDMELELAELFRSIVISGCWLSDCSCCWRKVVSESRLSLRSCWRLNLTC